MVNKRILGWQRIFPFVPSIWMCLLSALIWVLFSSLQYGCRDSFSSPWSQNYSPIAGSWCYGWVNLLLNTLCLPEAFNRKKSLLLCVTQSSLCNLIHAHLCSHAGLALQTHQSYSSVSAQTCFVLSLPSFILLTVLCFLLSSSWVSQILMRLKPLVLSHVFGEYCFSFATSQAPLEKKNHSGLNRMNCLIFISKPLRFADICSMGFYQFILNNLAWLSNIRLWFCKGEQFVLLC